MRGRKKNRTRTVDNRMPENHSPERKNNEQELGLKQAIKIAVSASGQKEQRVVFTKRILLWKNNRRMYEIRFIRGLIEYCYFIDAITGEILK